MQKALVLFTMVLAVLTTTVNAQDNAGNPDLSINYMRLSVDVDDIGEAKPTITYASFGG